MTEAEKFHKGQIEKAIEMARKDLNALSPGERVKLQADLHEFLLGGSVHMLVPLSEVTAEEIMGTVVPIRYVGEMIEGLRETLEWLVVIDIPNIITDPDRPGSIFTSATSVVTLQLRTDNPSAPFRQSFGMEPSKETARWALLYHVAHSGLSPDRITLCSRHECKNIFVLGTHADPSRVRYCGTKCSKAAALKAYREREAKKAKAKKKRSARK